MKKTINLSNTYAIVVMIALVALVVISWDAGADASDLHSFLTDYVPTNALGFAALLMLLDILMLLATTL